MKGECKDLENKIKMKIVRMNDKLLKQKNH